MKLTQELIDKIQEAMLHTNLKGEINWKDGDDIEVQIAGTFAKDKFIVLKNLTKNPFEMLNHILTLIMRRRCLLKMVEKNMQKNKKKL